ncbi:hypothetical protein AGABI2DRAFT_195117 [Agaricus bisporus var. bisporus H97]|uniref:hypothetical protein n=1 Tax=Agaricus bisporus var. bisporus (strain H97 / ATCC MYA-4626 / FGSC 10389) TaxID=936046 RepID=UPI00029F603A|nr:hypothetical protein AGABI2DRAFT_195117 [Agaricus bisporus var. bisporus H97]EKV43507.1 hypothetical protein AGABI2DRAFT_195117 [Agaricus bisporus var. bisporus H97]
MVSWKLAFGLSLSAQAFVQGVTIHHVPGQDPFAATTATAAAAAYTGAAAYDPTTLTPPPVPTNLNKNFQLSVIPGGVPGLSIKVPGRFFGFSVEMSVVEQLFGKNSTFIQVPFLNLMANILSRSGSFMIRVGGNTQETAEVTHDFDAFPNGRVMEKDLSGVTNPTQTPPLLITPGYLALLGNISSLMNIDWYLGIPFFDVANLKLDIVELGQQYLGEHLIGIEVGNEPDFYVSHGHRAEGYGPPNYVDEFGQVVSAMNNDANAANRKLLIGPNVDLNWNIQDVWDTGFVDRYNENLVALAVERYPTDNCFAQFGSGTPRNAQDEFPNYLTHQSGQDMAGPYLASTAFAQTKGKPFLMFETNTASCGGFAGISDVFGAALWAVDYAMTMAHSNFSGIMFHFGGQNVFYNPFTPPPTNQSAFHQWTVGPIYYSALVVAEAIGSSGNAQVIDLVANGGELLTPAYAIYENGQPVRMLLVNFVDDPSGNSDITASISVGGGQTGVPGATPASVKVKYLRAGSVSQKGNYTWAGQTWGDHFFSDGRPVGEEQIETVNCDQNAGVCNIPVHAPSVALVFLSDDAQTENSGQPSTTFATTARTKTFNTASVDDAVLATSNGDKDAGSKLGSTSKGSANTAQGISAHLPGLSVVLSLALGAVILSGKRW